MVSKYIPYMVQIVVDDLNEDTLRRIHGHLYEIGEANDEVIEHRQGFPAAVEMGWKPTLQHVAKCASLDEVDEVAAYIKDHIRERADRPRNRKVRRTARTICRQNGYEVDDYLDV